MQRILSLLHQQSLTTALRAVSTPVDRSHIDTAAFRRLCRDLRATMRKEGGIGLAAPQCGERLQLFVMDVQQPVHRRRMRSKQTTLPLAPQRMATALRDEVQRSEEEWDALLEKQAADTSAHEEDDEGESRDTDERAHSESSVILINPVILDSSPHPGLGEESCLSIPEYERHSQHFLGGVFRPACVDVRYVDEWNVERQMRLRGFDARLFQHEADHLNGVLFIDHITKPDEYLMHVPPETKTTHSARDSNRRARHRRRTTTTKL